MIRGFAADGGTALVRSRVLCELDEVQQLQRREVAGIPKVLELLAAEPEVLSA